MNYAILGCAPEGMGAAIAARLQLENDSKVFLADKEPGCETRALEKLKELPAGKNSEALRLSSAKNGVDIFYHREDYIQSLFNNNLIHVVVSALPAKLNLLAADLAINSGKNYCDLGGVLPITKKLLQPDMHARAKERNISLVTGNGFQPGTGSILAMNMVTSYFADWTPYPAVDSLIIYVGGLPLNIPYKKLFNLTGLEEIFFNRPLVLLKGKPVTIVPLAHYEVMKSAKDFGFCIGARSVELEAAVTCGLDALPYYLAGRVKTLQEKTIRYKSHYDLVKKLKKEHPREKFIEEFEKILSTYPPDNQDICVLKVEAVGLGKTGKKIKVEARMVVRSDETWTSMQKCTGFSAAISAKLIAEGKASPGAYPPEMALDTSEAVLELTKEFGIYVNTTPLE
ncbi:hypothetical protein HYT01_00605 [Candidatus Giovannonibacteria bacterium]|nr:hypothetical protein [Candidatus Giovannonibacteria bacterium]